MRSQPVEALEAVEEDLRSAGQMKHITVIILAIATVALVVVFVLQPDATVDYASFQGRFQNALTKCDGSMASATSCRGEEVPLPLSVTWHPRRWHKLATSTSNVAIGFGFPNSASRVQVAVDGSGPFDCFIRYLDGRAACISVRAHAAQMPQARTLRFALEGEFPGLPVMLENSM